MITIDEVKKLADLARISVSSEEAEKLTKEVDAILGYVGQIQEVTGEIKKTASNHRNIMREDVVTNAEGQYKKKLLNSAPSTEGEYFKVKKILG